MISVDALQKKPPGLMISVTEEELEVVAGGANSTKCACCGEDPTYLSVYSITIAGC